MTMSEKHITSVYDRDLEAVQAHIMKMGGLVEAAITSAARALEARDEELAQQVRKGDAAIDALEELINEEAARLIALRSPTAGDLRLVDPGVSRHHAEIRVEGSEVVAVDLGSTNGTFVNGQPIRRVTLRDGARVTLGRTTLVFRRDRE